MSNDEKYPESDDELLEESIVHNDDFRKEVYESLITGESLGKLIIKCIVQLEMTYFYKKYGKTLCYGTGTVYQVDQDKNAYVLTCAHNIRHKIKECIDCGQWMEIDQPCKCNSTNSRQKIIKANDIQCNRRSIECDQYGAMEHPYDAKCFYINEQKYNKYPTTNGGYDIAILSFVDSDNFYSTYCKHIDVQNIINGKKTMDNIDPFWIFGYPHDVNNPMQNGRMKGMRSIGNCKEWQVKQAKKTGQWYLKQCVIDTSTGQSGSALFYIDEINKKVVIFGVHTGGNEEKKFNIASFIRRRNEVILQDIEYCSKTTNTLRECEQELKEVANGLKTRNHKLNKSQIKCVENIKKTFDDFMLEFKEPIEKQHVDPDLYKKVLDENKQNVNIIAVHETKALDAKYRTQILSSVIVICVIIIVILFGVIMYPQMQNVTNTNELKPIALNIHSHLGHLGHTYEPENMLKADENFYCSLDNIKNSDSDWIVLSMSNENMLYNPTTIQLRIHKWDNRKFILNIGSIKTNEWIQIYQTNNVRKTNDTQTFNLNIDDEKWQTIQKQSYTQFKIEIMQSIMGDAEKSHTKHCIKEFNIFGIQVQQHIEL